MQTGQIIFVPLVFILLNYYVAGFFDADEIQSTLYDFTISSTPVLIDEKNDDDTSSNDKIDNFAPPKILVSSLPANFQPENSDFGETVFLANKHGRHFYCGLPKHVDNKAAELQARELRQKLLDNVTQEEVEALINAQLIRCIKKSNGWWTYEMCYKDGVVQQYHADEMGRYVNTSPKLNLGHLDPTSHWNKSLHYEKYAEKKNQLYFTKFFTHGAVCDLTGKMRESEVRFYCDDDIFGAELRRIDEPESCVYILHVFLTGLCRLQAFQPIDDKKPQNLIECLPTMTQDEKRVFEAKKAAENAQKVAQSSIKKPVDTVRKAPAKLDLMFHAGSKDGSFAGDFAERLKKQFKNLLRKQDSTTVEPETSKAFNFKTFIDEKVADWKAKKRSKNKKSGRNLVVNLKEQDNLLKLAMSLSKLITNLESQIESTEQYLDGARKRVNSLQQSDQKQNKLQENKQVITEKDGEMDRDMDQVFDDVTNSITDEIEKSVPPADQAGGVKVEVSAAVYDENNQKIRIIKNPGATDLDKFFLTMFGESDEKKREEERQTMLKENYEFDV